VTPLFLNFAESDFSLGPIHFLARLNQHKLHLFPKPNNAKKLLFSCAEYVCADAKYLPFKGESFDLVLCSEVLEHLDSPLKAIRELAWASKKVIVLTFPDERGVERFGKKSPAHVSKIQGLWVKSTLRNYGYEIIFYNILYFFLPCVTLDKLKILATRTLLRLANTLSNHLSLSFLNKLALSKTYVLMLVKQI
jgi:2-polyprenyl-3-methyl-5-hydroxy-6-metoxy-1,4-benzoquinol methylase